MVHVAVVGAGAADAALEALAEEAGALLAARGAVVVTGGLGGVMAAASRGARAAGGTTLGLLPGAERRDANPWVAVAVPTGMGELRNGLVVGSADALIAIGGGAGTLSEIALALKAGKRVVGLRSWEIDGMVPVDTPGAAVARVLGDDARPPEVAMVVTCLAAAGREDEVAALFAQLRGPSRLEPGCVRFEVHRVPDDPRTFVVYESFADQAALDAHRASPHFAAIARERLFPLLESRTRVMLGPLGSG